MLKLLIIIRILLFFILCKVSCQSSQTSTDDESTAICSNNGTRRFCLSKEVVPPFDEAETFCQNLHGSVVASLSDKISRKFVKNVLIKQHNPGKRTYIDLRYINETWLYGDKRPSKQTINAFYGEGSCATYDDVHFTQKAPCNGRFRVVCERELPDPCDSSPCKHDGTCTSNGASFQCHCASGFFGNSCESDIDECGISNICSPNATCKNEVGSFLCTCNYGFTGNGETCTDINECQRSKTCSQYATCKNEIGSFTCICDSGFTGDGRICTDINECQRSKPCSQYATCKNEMGSFTCTCNSGFTGDGRVCTVPSSFQVSHSSLTLIQNKEHPTVICSSTGNPPIQLIWKKNGREISNNYYHNVYQTLKEFNSTAYEAKLQFQQIHFKDGGKYVCEKTAEEKLSLNITVEGPPQINKHKLTTTPGINKVSYTCTFDADPQPTITWFFSNGSNIPKTSQFQVNQKRLVNHFSYSSTLTVYGTNCLKTNSFKFFCSASNNHSLQSANSTNSSIYSEIKRFHIHKNRKSCVEAKQFCEGKKKRLAVIPSQDVAKNIHRKGLFWISDASTKYLPDEFEKTTNGSCIVVQLSYVLPYIQPAIPSDSHYFICEKPKKIQPTKIKNISTLENTCYGNSLSIHWTPLPGSNNISYEISVNKSGRLLVPPGLNSTTITELTPQTYYNIQVKPLFEGCEMDEPFYPQIFRTGRNKLVPPNITSITYNRTLQQCSVTWIYTGGSSDQEIERFLIKIVGFKNFYNENEKKTNSTFANISSYLNFYNFDVFPNSKYLVSMGAVAASPCNKIFEPIWNKELTGSCITMVSSTSTGLSGMILTVIIVMITIVLFATIILFVVIHRRRKKSATHFSDEQENIEMNPNPLPSNIVSLENNDPVYVNVTPSYSTTNNFSKYRIAPERILKIYKQKRQNEGKKFSEEFKVALCAAVKALNIDTSIATKKENLAKNRFKNILPSNKNRVVINMLPGVPHSDYINASFIDGYNQPSKFIAAQGPKQTTIADFWRMIVLHQCSVIVMVTQLKEGRKEKCVKYWPDPGEQIQHGNFLIGGKNQTCCGDFRATNLIITNLSDSLQHEIIHFHYLNWPDHGVPPTTTGLLKLHKAAFHAQSGYLKPMVVHCSAGVGRTGTFIAFDILLHQMKAEKQINIFETILKLRSCRTEMVQSLDQYMLLHKLMAEVHLMGTTEIDVQQFLSYKEAKLQESTTSTGINKEFALLGIVPPSFVTTREGLKPINQSMNIDDAFLPYDSNLVRLTMTTNNFDLPYINASYIQAYFAHSYIMVAQDPIAQNINLYWRCIIDHQIKCLIMIEENQDFCENYWGSSEESMKFGDISVRILDEVDCSTHVERKIELIEESNYSMLHQVNQIVVSGWGITKTPSPTSILQIVKVMEQAFSEAVVVKEKKTFAFIHCRDGSTQSGTLCAIYNLIERVKSENVVDVFRAVKDVRDLRMGAVGSEEQLKFCYKVVATYIQSLSLYENIK